MSMLIMGVSLLIIKFTEKNATALAMVAVVAPMALSSAREIVSSHSTDKNKNGSQHVLQCIIHIGGETGGA